MLLNPLENAPEISFQGAAGLSKPIFPNEPNFPYNSYKINSFLAAKRTDKTTTLSPIHGRYKPAAQENTR
jgi:hypothetical protein